MSPDPLRVALIGYGFAGRTFHAPLIRATPGLSLAVIVSRDAAKVRADVPEASVVASFDEAIEAVDVVVIATPNDTHAPLATAALERRKHVVVDKPFTLDLAEARALATLAQGSGRILSVFQNRRWDSDFLGARAIIAEGVLGEIVHFESHFDRYRPEVRDRWREKPGPGSGLWIDLGPHLIDQVLQLFGLPRAISASLAEQRSGAQTDDWAHAVLDYGPLRVVLHAAVLVAGGVPRMAVHGTKASWIKYGLDVQESQLLAGVRPGDASWGVDPEPGHLYDGASGSRTERSVPPGDYRQYYVQLREAIRGHAENPVSPAQAVAVMATLEAASVSSRGGRVMLLPLTEEERASWR